MEFRVPFTERTALLRDFQISIPSGREYKRVYVYKLDAYPSGEAVGGQLSTRVTAVFRVLDGPVTALAVADALLNKAGYTTENTEVSGSEWILLERVGRYWGKLAVGAALLVSLLIR
jgi:hypothetical protein